MTGARWRCRLARRAILAAIVAGAACGSNGPTGPGDGPPPAGSQVFVGAGDNAYFNATAQEFAQCYDPFWGRHKPRTYAVPGNHDYLQPGAGPYFAYFGDRAGPSGLGYYSFNLGAWHIITLNSEIATDAA